jgi:ferrochelatase
LAAVAAPYSVDNYDRILFSFHGLPQRQLTKANPSHCTPATQACCIQNSSCQKLCYSAQCRATAYALQAKLNLPTDKCRLCFQSRLGNEPWLEPFTSEVIAGCAKAGDKRLLLFCPAFTADCLETLFEIGVEYRDEFLAAGGLQLDLVPSLNDHPAWVEALYQLVLKRGHKVLELEAQFSS